MTHLGRQLQLRLEISRGFSCRPVSAVPPHWSTLTLGAVYYCFWPEHAAVVHVSSANTLYSIWLCIVGRNLLAISSCIIIMCGGKLFIMCVCVCVCVCVWAGVRYCYVCGEGCVHLIFPITFLWVLDDSVTELEDVANGLVSLVHKVADMEQGHPPTRTIHRDSYARHQIYVGGETTIR